MSPEDNKAVVRRWTEEAWNKGNLSGVEEIDAASYVGHDPASPIGDTRGPEGAKQFVATYRRAFPDTHITIEAMVVDGDTVVTALRRGAPTTARCWAWPRPASR